MNSSKGTPAPAHDTANKRDKTSQPHRLTDLTSQSPESEAQQAAEKLIESFKERLAAGQDKAD